MLTADLVRTRRVKDELKIVAIKPEARAPLLSLAERLLGAARAGVGGTRGELMEALGAIPVSARDTKLAAGLTKLLLDRCEFSGPDGLDPVDLRREVFEAAARARASKDEPFDRDALLASVAAKHEVSAEGLEAALYADLKENHTLLSFDVLPAEALLHEYELSSEQAVLLKAERVVLVVHGSSPAAYRRLFRTLKFRRLLYTAESLASGGYRFEIDGPFSLFSSVTKYGLALALLVPALRETERFSLSATVRWGKERRRLRFALEGGLGAGGGPAAEVSLPDEVQALKDGFAKHAGPWKVRRATRIFSLPGVGAVVPDLSFTHAESGVVVHLEALGYWSREAVFRRIDLVEGGLDEPFLFAVPARLRVSEELLEEDASASLYVYKGVLRAKLIRERLDALAERRGMGSRGG